MQAPPRLLLLVTKSDWGGAQHVVHALAASLRGRFDVYVACAPGGPLVDRLAGLGVRTVAIPEFSYAPVPWNDVTLLRRLEALLRRERVDLVHAHSTRAGFWGRLAAHRVGVPAVVFTAHGWAFTEGRPAWTRAPLAAAERQAARWTTRIICVSDYDRRLAERFNVGRPEQLVVIRNGVAPEPPPADGGAGIRRALGVRHGPMITCVGRLAPQKDPLTLLRAMETLGTGTLVFVGDGPLRSQVEAFVGQRGLTARVVVAGGRPDARAIIAASDLFVLSSRWEGLPIAMIEAMMAALPVVATRVGGVSELVDDGTTGLLVPPRDPSALAGALGRLLADPELRARMGEAGRQTAMQAFTLERMVRETEALYEAVLR